MTDPLAERIVDAALSLAEESGWERVRLRLVAQRLDIPVTEVMERFRDRDALADAWFRRGWLAMAAPLPEGFSDLEPAERAHFVLMRWFEALAPHRRVSGEMLREKLYPSHPHHWVPLIFHLSRTIQWLRDLSMLDAGGTRRQAEEVWLTGAFLTVLPVWLRDDDAGLGRTRDALWRNLASGASPLRGSRAGRRYSA